MNKTTDLKIFLVEQRAEMNGTFLSILHELNFNDIHIFKDAEVAWQEYQKSSPDLIICDWYPDKKDSLGLLKRVRSDKGTTHTPFIIVSGIVEHDMVNQAISMGVDEYIVKPFNIKIFEDKIYRATASKQHSINLAPSTVKKLDGLSDFKSKVAICINDSALLELIAKHVNSAHFKAFDKLASVLKDVKNDVLIDIVVVEDAVLWQEKSLHPLLLSLISSGQIEVIVIKADNRDNSYVRDLKSIGFRHFVYPHIDIDELDNKIETLITLKKALLHTKDTFSRLVNEQSKEKEFQENLVRFIRKESTKISEKSEQILSTSKKSSFAYQLSHDISLSAKNIESISNVFESVSKDVKELESFAKEKVSITDIFANAEQLFEQTLEKRQLTFNIESESSIVAFVNPTLFTSLFMFVLRAVLADARFDSSISLKASAEENILYVEVCSLMAGYPHLKSISDRVWFERDGQMKFSLKASIKQLASSQQVSIRCNFNHNTEQLMIALEVHGLLSEK